MSIANKGVLVIVSALGLLVAAPAHAQEYGYSSNYGYGYSYNAPSWQVRFRPHRWHRWFRPPVVVAQPGYSYEQPDYRYDFSSHVRAELAAIEAAVRDRVAAGELDGSALTAMESSRDDVEQDVVDLSAKGYLTDADRAHVESDVVKLRQKFGC